MNGMMGEFYWDFGDGNSAMGQTVTHTFANQGTYQVCLTTMLMNNPADSCIWTTCHEVIVGNGGPGSLQAGFEVFQDSTIALLYHFINTSSGQPVEWLWEFGDGTTSNLQNPSHQYAQSGWYQVCLTVFGMGLTDTYCQEFEMSALFLDINNPNLDILSGQVYPNPNNGAFMLDLTSNIDELIDLKILNNLGQQIYLGTKQLSSGKNSLDIQLTNLQPGIYCLYVTDNRNTIVRKFVVE